MPHLDQIHVTTGVWVTVRALASATVWVTFRAPSRGFRA